MSSITISPLIKCFQLLSSVQSLQVCLFIKITIDYKASPAPGGRETIGCATAAEQCF